MWICRIVQKMIAERVIHEFIMTFWLLAIYFVTNQMLSNRFCVFISIPIQFTNWNPKSRKFPDIILSGAYNEVMYNNKVNTKIIWRLLLLLLRIIIYYYNRFCLFCWLQYPISFFPSEFGFPNFKNSNEWNCSLDRKCRIISILLLSTLFVIRLLIHYYTFQFYPFKTFWKYVFFTFDHRIEIVFIEPQRAKKKFAPVFHWKSNSE